MKSIPRYYLLVSGIILLQIFNNINICNSTSTDCSDNSTLSNSVECNKVSISKYVIQSSDYYNKSLKIDANIANSIKKEITIQKMNCGNDFKCIANVYDLTNSKYNEVINGNLNNKIISTSNNRDNRTNDKIEEVKKIDIDNKQFTNSNIQNNTNDNIPTRRVQSDNSEVIQNVKNVLSPIPKYALIFLFIGSFVSFIIGYRLVWKMFHLSVSLEEAVKINTIQYYFKRFTSSLLGGGVAAFGAFYLIANYYHIN